MCKTLLLCRGIKKGGEKMTVEEKILKKELKKVRKELKLVTEELRSMNVTLQ